MHSSINNTLEQKLDQIRAVFNIDELLTLSLDKSYIQKYYQANKLAYSLFHTYSGIIHMGISRDGVYKEDDLLEAARIIERYIGEIKATNSLELASGRGGTSVWLAKRHPKIDFDGIELSPGQIVYAQKQARRVRNYHPIQGDYHDLSNYPDDSMDVVFVIEALCYSEDKSRVLSEAKRVLKPSGVFIIFDAYTKKDRSKMAANELLACRLTEKSMAVNKFGDYQSLLSDANKLAFTVESSEEVSQFILPTLRRFESLAKRFFKHPIVAKGVTKLSSKELTYNAISGLLMTDLIEGNLVSYYITVLRKG